jgi:cobalt-zinc-cadmium efflux system membrane fusion protein
MKSIYFVSIILALLSFSCSKKEEKAEASKGKLTPEQLKDLTFASVEYLPLQSEITLNGKVIPDENNLVNVYPMIGGKILSVDFEIGDLVDTKKSLVVINSGEAREFEKELISAEDEYELAKKNLQIQQELFSTNFSSERELAYAKKDLQLAKAELSRLKEVYNVYSITDGGKYVVKSPVAGFILEKKIGPNMQIRSDASDYLFSVARLDQVYVAFDIYEKDIPHIKIGQQVKIHSIAFPDSVIYGKISRIENSIDPTTRTIKARVLISNVSYKLKPEMYCTGKVAIQEEGMMNAIPNDAVVFDKNKYYVMVYHSKNRIETRQIEIHSKTDKKTYVSSGLRKGEKLIVRNQLFIYDALND